MQQWFTKLIAVSMAMLLWGNPVFANVSPTANLLEEDVSKIATWTNYLNATYPNLSLHVAVPVDSQQTSRAVLREINQLKDELQGVRDFPPGSFTTLACIRIECGGVTR